MSELRTPLEIALARRDVDAVRQRLRAGDTPQDPNHLGIPVLFDGLRSNNLDLLDVLDAAGADWTIPYNPGGYTPLIYAVLHGELATIKWLIAHGQPIAQRTDKGVGVMHVCVQRDEIEIARYLYEHGADVFSATVHGETPLLISLKSKHGLSLFRFILACYDAAQRDLSDKLLPCLGCIFDKQRPDAIEAVQALLPLATDVPDESDIRGYMSLPGNFASSPFRSLENTLSSRLSYALFALLKAERLSRSCTRPGDQTVVWKPHSGL